MPKNLDAAGSAGGPAAETDQDLKTLGSGVGVGLVGRVVGRVVLFVSQVVVARSLTPTGYGMFSVAWTILRMGGFIAMSGLQNGVVRFASAYRKTDPANVRTIIRRCLLLGLVTGATAGFLVFVSASWLTTSVFDMAGLTPALQIVAISLPVMAASRIAAVSTRVSQRMVYSVVADDFGQPAVFLGLLGILALTLGLGITSSLAAMGGSFAVSLGLSILFIQRLFPKASREGADLRSGSAHRLPENTPGIRALLAFSLPTALAAILSQFILWTDRLFLGHFGSAAHVGIYEAIAQLTVPFLTVLAAFNAVVAPMVASLQTERRRVEQLFRISTKWGLYVTLPYFLTLLFAGRELIQVLFGASYTPGFHPLLVLSLGQLVNVGTGSIAMILIMSGHQHRWLRISGLSFALNLILNYFLVPRFDLMGAAVATGVATGAMFLTAVWATAKTLGLWAYDRRYFKGAIAAVVTGLALLAARSWIHLPPIAWVLFTISATGGTFLLTLRIVGLEDEDLQLLELIASQARARLLRH